MTGVTSLTEWTLLFPGQTSSCILIDVCKRKVKGLIESKILHWTIIWVQMTVKIFKWWNRIILTLDSSDYVYNHYRQKEGICPLLGRMYPFYWFNTQYSLQVSGQNFTVEVTRPLRHLDLTVGLLIRTLKKSCSLKFFD